jgi:WhiB family redox-sensing transcriptional regulator
MSTTYDTEWMSQMACTGHDPDELFMDGAAQSRGKRICAPCPVKAECLAYAKERGIDHGVWGGFTDRERRELDRKFPSVTDWKRFILDARSRQGAV